MAIVNARVGSSINNGRLQPFQGLDTLVYVQDQATGNLIELGEFMGFQYTVRNASEPYLVLGSRTMNYLDGEYQIGLVLEQGKVNLAAMGQLLGYNDISPVNSIGRSPRFQIVVEYNAKELDGKGVYNTTNGGATELIVANAGRLARGRYVFTQCKLDAFTSGAQSGRQIIADRMEFLAEGISLPQAAAADNTLLSDGRVNRLSGAAVEDTITFDNVRGRAGSWSTFPTSTNNTQQPTDV